MQSVSRARVTFQKGDGDTEFECPASCRHLAICDTRYGTTQNIFNVSTGKWSGVALVNGFDANAQFAKVVDIRTPSWSGDVDGRAALHSFAHEPFQSPAVTARNGYCKGAIENECDAEICRLPLIGLVSQDVFLSMLNERTSDDIIEMQPTMICTPAQS